MLLFYPFPVAVHEHLLRTSDDFVWQVDAMSHGRFTIDVEFLDLRIANNNASIQPRLVFLNSHLLLNASMTWEIPATFCWLLPVCRNLNDLAYSSS